MRSRRGFGNAPMGGAAFIFRVKYVTAFKRNNSIYSGFIFAKQ